MGRKPTSPERKKTEGVTVYLSQADLAAFKAAARKDGFPLSIWLSWLGRQKAAEWSRSDDRTEAGL